jgi:hypothetical protein
MSAFIYDDKKKPMSIVSFRVEKPEVKFSIFFGQKSKSFHFSKPISISHAFSSELRSSPFMMLFISSVSLSSGVVKINGS